MSKRWIRLSTAIYDNRKKWDLELDLILALQMFEGVRINIGLSGGNENDIAAGSAPDTSPNLGNLEYIVRRCAAVGLKVLIGLGGEGPPKTTTFWQGKNSGNTWLDVKRPPLGTSNGVVNATRALKQKVIDKVVDIYLSYALDPYQHIYWELYNEPAIGGAGAPPSGSFYTTAGLSFSANQGRWDIAGDYSSLSATQGAAFLDFFTLELEGLDFKGCRCVSPTFTAAYLDTELSTFDQQVPPLPAAGKKWIDVCRANAGFVELIFGINCYYDAFDLLTTGLHPYLYAGPCLGPVENAELSIYGNDFRGAESGDNQCFARKIAKLRANSRIGRSRIAICEVGIQPGYMGMTGDTSAPSVGAMTFNYFVNFQKLGEAQIELLDEALKLDVEFAALFTATNVSTAWTQFYGFYENDVDLNPPTIPNIKLFATWLAWARRSGLPLTALINSQYGAFFGAGFRKGDYEVLP